MNSLRIGALAASALLLLGAGARLLTTHQFLDHAATAEGTVIALSAGGSHPQISFTTASHETITFPQGGMIFGYKPGDKVAVLYETGAPRSSATIDVPGALWFTPGLLALLGLFCAVAARFGAM
jgi:hypothetical protein